MNRKRTCQLICCLSLIFCSFPALSWDRNIAIGYGISRDPNNTVDVNSGVLLNSDLFTLYQNNYWHWTINGALGRWHTTSETHKNLFTGALSLGLRLYAPRFSNLHPYLLVTGGPAYLSSRQFGDNHQGSNFAFQTTGGVGVEMLNCNNRGWDLNLRLVHYSNAYLFKPNEGYNIVYLLSLGYLF